MQSISVLEFRRVKANVRGPFLVVAPLTTLGHWRREIETWTDMNVVCFMGGAADRQIIVDYEMHYREAPTTLGGRGRKTKTPKFNVLLTSYEILRDTGNIFNVFYWDSVIVDEAHRLKSIESAVRCAIIRLPALHSLAMHGRGIALVGVALPLMRQR